GPYARTMLGLLSRSSKEKHHEASPPIRDRQHLAAAARRGRLLGGGAPRRPGLFLRCALRRAGRSFYLLRRNARHRPRPCRDPRSPRLDALRRRRRRGRARPSASATSQDRPRRALTFRRATRFRTLGRRRAENRRKMSIWELVNRLSSRRSRHAKRPIEL